MSTRVILLRHAESADPTVFHGAESDIGLSERGRRQAEAAAPVLAAFGPAVVVSSAMCRARETALPIAVACGLPLHVEPELHERRVGVLSGRPVQDGVWPETLARWVAGDTAYAPDGAESFDAIGERVLPVWRRLTAAHAGRTLLIVAHGVVIRVLLLNLLPGQTPSDWNRLGRLHNLGVTELLFDGSQWTALRLNEVPAAAAACR